MKGDVMKGVVRGGVAAVSLALVTSFGAMPANAQGTDPSGAVVYAQHCASCHEQVDARMPTRDALTRLSPARILRTLDFGLMMSIAYPLKRSEREAVARWFGRS